MDWFDYVIVGAGSAGCVIANRLVRAGYTVCVLEAGPVDSNFFIHLPVGFVKTLLNPTLTWQFKTEPSAGSGGRSINLPQGKTLGGSSSVNGMVFVRGQPNDYDNWAQRGNLGWSYDDVLPHFRNIENRLAPHDVNFRGAKGLLPVSDPDWRHPLCEAFIEGAASVGIPRNPDYNGAVQEGAGYYQRTIRRARRVSAARAYLYPVMKNSRLKVLTNCRATSISFEGKRATGVAYRIGETIGEAKANREVIVSAGAINSPRLLELSGVGNPQVLSAAGVSVTHDLPGVGENLADHYSPRMIAKAKNIETINELVRGPRLAKQAVNWLIGKPSILGLSAVVCHAFGRSDPALDTPDFTIIFTPGSSTAGRLGVMDDHPGMTIGPWQMRPQSTGHVHIRSANVNADPVIQPNYLQHHKDKQALLAAIRVARSILHSAPMAHYFDSEMLPGADAVSDDELLAFARAYGSTSYHMAGSCRMGPATDPNTVVDADLKVHGLQALRVADASIFPTMVSANTYATSLLVGEKAAAAILASERLKQAA
ncbi:GMC family oxidoreductase [Bradyrhizobium sp. ma5]|uniref:GMC family oxidoreductase n=1 Tax=Bradyrhizobium sp. ma5 TaxID=3344828 RepID=UPI0035D4D185